jgi:hypothetical protein
MADQSYSDGPSAGISQSPYGRASSYNYGGGPSYNAPSSVAANPGGLRRRAVAPQADHNSASYDYRKSKKAPMRVVEKLDFMFPKVDQEFTVKTKGGGVASLVASGLIAVLILAELVTWIGQNRIELSKTYVDNSLGKQMKVNLNITFPGLSCSDLHVDLIDVAGDSQIDVHDTLVKRKMSSGGLRFLSKPEEEAELNLHKKQQTDKDRILKEALPADYCGPCYGAEEAENRCCQTCDEVIEAYTKKRWKIDLLKFTSEQCIREGRDKQEPKRMTKNEACNLSGYITLNRVAGNFHIAMGEGVERDGRHIHTYVPEDAPNFNVSHTIHELSFGIADGTEPLTGVTKIVTEDTGTTGLFQYFIKIVPTTYVGEDAFPNIKRGPESDLSLYEEIEDSMGGKKKKMESYRYFITERFMPLMTELLEDHHKEEGDNGKHAVYAGHVGGHHNEEHHKKQNAVLPGIFFIYDIYPFAVEVSRNSVPFTHLLIRIMATIGGVFTLTKWADSCIYEHRGSSF